MVSILLVGIFLYHFMGIFIRVKIEHALLHEFMEKKIEAGLEETDIEKLIISPEEAEKIEWFEKDEFRFKGQVYDVVKYTVADDGTLFIECINDSEEQELYEELDKELNAASENQGNSESLPYTRDWLENLYCTADLIPMVHRYLSETANNKIYFPEKQMTSLSLAPSGPPPKQKQA